MHPNFQKVLDEFIKEGFEDDAYLRQVDIQQLLDKFAKRNARFQKFDREIMKELWDNTLKNDEGDCVLLKDYIETICEAQDILRQKIQKIQDKYSSEANQQKRKEFMVSIYSLSQDEKMICAPFRIGQALPSKLIELSRNSIHPNDKTSTSIFSEEITLQHKFSRGLTIVAYLTFIGLLLQTITIIAKFDYYGLLVFIWVGSIFLLNYFDRVYMRFVFLNLIFSIVLDSVWFAMKIDSYWNPSQQISAYKHKPGFLKFIIVISILITAFKVVMAAILWRYGGNPHGTRRKASFTVLNFNLDANPVRNVITPVITKTFPKFLIR